MFVFGRTFYCGEVTEDQIGQSVVLKGWVQKRRDLGGLIFIYFATVQGLYKLSSIQTYQKRRLRQQNQFVMNMSLILKERLSQEKKQRSIQI
ncbi:hypothetical protein BSAF29S_00513 [Bacillus safensis subsp. safensis]